MGLLSKLLGPRPPRVRPAHLDDSNFVGEVHRSELPVLVDVWSPGCSPCRMLEPIVGDLATDYHGRVKVAELNAAEAGRTAARYVVMGTPTLLFFDGGREVGRVVGYVGSRRLRELVDAQLLGADAAAG
jgi:thioredoxin 1